MSVLRLHLDVLMSEFVCVTLDPSIDNSGSWVRRRELIKCGKLLQVKSEI